MTDTPLSSNLVADLRTMCECSGLSNPAGICHTCQAADEIDRLTASFDAAKREWEIAAAERDRLRAALPQIMNAVRQYGHKYTNEEILALAYGLDGIADRYSANQFHRGASDETSRCQCPEVCQVCGGRVAACAVVGHRAEKDRYVKWHECPI